MKITSAVSVLAILFLQGVHAMMQEENCTFPLGENAFLALSRTQACFCDDNNRTQCKPNDLCFRLPADDASIECLVVPCDDISGDWIYVDVMQASSDRFVATAKVEITQSNCDSEIKVLTANETMVFYGSFFWQEIFWLYVFESKQIRDSYSVTGTYKFDPESRLPLNSTTFIPDFESSEPQCQYVGDFGFGIGALYRIPINTTYSIGQEIPRDELPIDCPNGYPKQWTMLNDTTMIDVMTPTTAAPAQRTEVIANPSAAPAPPIGMTGKPVTAPVSNAAFLTKSWKILSALFACTLLY